MSLKTRIADQTKWPRSWMNLPQPLLDDLGILRNCFTNPKFLPCRWFWTEEALNGPDPWWELTDLVKRNGFLEQHNELSRTIRRVMLALVAYIFFCLLTLAAPDANLLAANANIDVPFADVKIQYASFLFVGPLILIVLTAYLQVFFGRWIAMGGREPHDCLPFLFNMPGAAPKAFTYLLFYWAVPGLLVVFAWKGLPRPGMPWLVLTAALVTAVLVFLQIRRCPAPVRGLRNAPRWVLFSVLTCLAGMAGGDASTDTGFLHTLQFSRTLDLRKAWLVDQDLRGLNLDGANLVEANLSSADLRGARLRKADMTGVNLAKANLSRAQLAINLVVIGDVEFEFFGIQLIHRPGATDLSNATLIGANLKGAKFNEAVLNSTNLNNANLGDANFSGAYLKNAILTGADVENAEFFKTTFGAPNNAGIAAGVLPIAKLPNLMIFDVKQPDAEQQAACDHIKTAKNWKSAKMDFKCAE